MPVAERFFYADEMLTVVEITAPDLEYDGSGRRSRPTAGAPLAPSDNDAGEGAG